MTQSEIISINYQIYTSSFVYQFTTSPYVCVHLEKILILLLVQKTTVCLGVLTASKTYTNPYLYTYFELNHKNHLWLVGEFPKLN